MVKAHRNYKAGSGLPWQFDHLAVPLIVPVQTYQCHGDPARAIAHYREALALAEAADEPQLLFSCYDRLATGHRDLGDERRAEEFMQKAQAVCERVGFEPGALVVFRSLIDSRKRRPSS